MINPISEPVLKRTYDPFHERKENEKSVRKKLKQFINSYKSYNWELVKTYEDNINRFISEKPNEFILTNRDIILDLIKKRKWFSFKSILSYRKKINKEQLFLIIESFGDLLWYTSEENNEEWKYIYDFLFTNIDIFFPDDIKRQEVEKIKLKSYLNNSVRVRYEYFNQLVSDYPDEKKAINSLSFCLICRLVKNKEYQDAEFLLNKYYAINDTEKDNLKLAKKYFQWGKFYFHRANNTTEQSNSQYDIYESINCFQKAIERYNILTDVHIHQSVTSPNLGQVVKVKNKK